jgi:hypothetical protein
MKKVGDFMLLPPAPDVCQECATKHEPESPHNAHSLYYQLSFKADHGRWPTWKDAVAHCPEDIKRVWIAELKKHGAWKE